METQAQQAPRSGTECFRVNGEWITDFARTRMLEGHEGHAYAVLAEISSDGNPMPVGIASEILAGNQALVGVNSLELVEETPERRAAFLEQVAFAYSGRFYLENRWWRPIGVLRQTAGLISAMAESGCVDGGRLGEVGRCQPAPNKSNRERYMSRLVCDAWRGSYMVRWLVNPDLTLWPNAQGATGILTLWPNAQGGGGDRGVREGNRSGTSGSMEPIIFEAVEAPPGIFQPELHRRELGAADLRGLTVFMAGRSGGVFEYDPEIEEQEAERYRVIMGLGQKGMQKTPKWTPTKPEVEPADPDGPSPENIEKARIEIRKQADSRPDNAGWWRFEKPLPGGRQVVVPRAPFLNWALKGCGLADVRQHPDLKWLVVSGYSWKMHEDNRFHTDWMVGAVTMAPDGTLGTLALDEWHYQGDCPLRNLAFGEMDRAQDWARETCGAHNVITTLEDLDRLDRVEAVTARFLESQAKKKPAGALKVIVHCGDGQQVLGRIYYPEPGEACPETNMVAIVPNGTEQYEEALLSAACTVLLRGGGLSHLVTVARGEGLAVVGLTSSTSREPIPEGTPVCVDLLAGTITVVDAATVPPGEKRRKKGDFDDGIDLGAFLRGEEK